MFETHSMAATTSATVCSWKRVSLNPLQLQPAGSVASHLSSQDMYQLKRYLANVHSLNKFSDLPFYNDTNNPDAFVFTETWLDQSMPSGLFADCSTFNVFRKDCPARGGGDCMLIKKSSTTVANQVVPHGFDNLENVVVDLSDCNNTLPIWLVAVYRSPSQ